MTQSARYSNVERRTWNDPRFRRKLTPIPPCGQGLWLYLMTTPALGVLPGLILMGEAAMAEHLEWSLEAFREAFAEVLREGMAEADWGARIVILPKAITRRRPQSPNVIRSWRAQWLEVPDDSPLKRSYYRRLKAFIEALPKGFQEAFAEAIPESESESESDHGDGARAREVTPPSRVTQHAKAPTAAAATAAPRRPLNLEEALATPLRRRCQALAADQHLAQWVQPERWPELVQAAQAWETATGLKALPLGAYERDSAVRQLVGLFADGVELERVLGAIQLVPADPWFAEGKRGLGSLTPEVLRRLEAPSSNGVRKATRHVQRGVPEDVDPEQWGKNGPLHQQKEIQK